MYANKYLYICKYARMHMHAGELFAQCPLDGYPCAAMEQVADSSRYFVIRIQDELGRSVGHSLLF